MKNSFIEKTYVVGTHWNCLIVLLHISRYLAIMCTELYLNVFHHSSHNDQAAKCMCENIGCIIVQLFEP